MRYPYSPHSANEDVKNSNLTAPGVHFRAWREIRFRWEGRKVWDYGERGSPGRVYSTPTKNKQPEAYSRGVGHWYQSERQ